MCYHAVSNILRNVELPAGAKIVLLALADRLPAGGTECYVGQPAIAQACGFSERAVRDHIADLEARGYVERTRRMSSDGTRLFDAYRINLHSEPADSAASEGVIANRQISSSEAAISAPRVIGKKDARHSEPADFVSAYNKEAIYKPEAIKQASAASPRPVDRPATEEAMTLHRNTAPPPADWIPPEAWAEWRQHRGRKLTAPAIARQVATLDRLRAEGHNLAEVIGAAIECGWATFYAPRGRRNPAGRKADHRSDTLNEIFGGSNDGHDETPERDISGEAVRLP